MSVASKSSLSPARRRLLELMQSINFGRIENMEVRGGDPVFDPLPHVVREIKLGADDKPRPEVALADFCLKAQVVDLWNRLDQLGTGTVELLEVKHGLPFQIVIPEVSA
ncbi:MAG: hypothetical protein FJ304_27025 [Planctomycetes bacterium]|nr:hypothetical protein [Planctomycetota bacterium]